MNVSRTSVHVRFNAAKRANRMDKAAPISGKTP